MVEKEALMKKITSQIKPYNFSKFLRICGRHTKLHLMLNNTV